MSGTYRYIFFKFLCVQHYTLHFHTHHARAPPSPPPGGPQTNDAANTSQHRTTRMHMNARACLRSLVGGSASSRTVDWLVREDRALARTISRDRRSGSLTTSCGRTSRRSSAGTAQRFKTNQHGISSQDAPKGEWARCASRAASDRYRCQQSNIQVTRE